jgi:FLVCR family MFS transporter 7
MQSEYRAYSYRWLILAIFCSLEMTNNILWVTFAPISDIASNYFGGGSYGSTTAVNMLANTFLILYLPGTGLSILLMKYCNMKRALEICAFLTTFGAMLRYIASAYRNDWGNENAYLVMLLGQAFAAMGQPMFLNSPPAIASIWFPTTEREMATTIGSMCAPIGSAIGQIIPFLLVTQSSINGKDLFLIWRHKNRELTLSDHISQRMTTTAST